MELLSRVKYGVTYILFFDNFLLHNENNWKIFYSFFHYFIIIIYIILIYLFILSFGILGNCIENR